MKKRCELGYKGKIERKIGTYITSKRQMFFIEMLMTFYDNCTSFVKSNNCL